MKIEFGSKHTSEIIDNEGSTKTLKEDFTAGDTKKPTRVEYKIRTRVTSPTEERHEYEQFSKLLEYDTSMLDAAFLIEHSIAGNKNGYYYVVRCYTRLEY